MERYIDKEEDLGHMSDKFESFVDELQNEIFEETREAYGDIAFERWLHPLYMGRIENPDGYGRVHGSCGDTMEIFLRIEKDRIREASFQTDGCGSSSVCGSFAAEMALKKTPDAILEITGDAIITKLGGLPKEDEHCAHLAAEALQEALNDYMIKMTQKDDNK
jgi:nitrogen fixation NifU-like protein